LKSPEIAQANGLDFNKKLLKKLLMEPISEPTRFFYDSEFDYGGEAGKQPMLYIGEIPTMWKKYIKEHKKEKTFAAGLCMTDGKDGLKLEVQTGKGGKAMVLKAINKELLKPFAKAYFVETVNSTVEIEDTEEKPDSGSDELDNIDPSELISEANTLMKEAQGHKATLEKAVKEVGSQLKDLKNTIITEDLIKKTDNALLSIEKIDLSKFLKEANAWFNSLDNDLLSKAPALGKASSDLKKIVDELTKLQPDLKLIVENGPKMKMVENPLESEFPPISDDPFENFGAAILGLSKKSSLDKHVNDLKVF
jgi:hypothetical protein